MSERTTRTSEVALWLLAGAAVGAGTALLLAPRSGRQTRRGIARLAKRAGRRTERIVEDFSGTVRGMVDEVGKEARDILDKGNGIAHDAKKELLKALEAGQERLEKQRMTLAKLIG